MAKRPAPCISRFNSRSRIANDGARSRWAGGALLYSAALPQNSPAAALHASNSERKPLVFGLPELLSAPGSAFRSAHVTPVAADFRDADRLNLPPPQAQPDLPACLWYFSTTAPANTQKEFMLILC